MQKQPPGEAGGFWNWNAFQSIARVQTAHSSAGTLADWSARSRCEGEAESCQGRKGAGGPASTPGMTAEISSLERRAAWEGGGLSGIAPPPRLNPKPAPLPTCGPGAEKGWWLGWRRGSVRRRLGRRQLGCSAAPGGTGVSVEGLRRGGGNI